MAGQDPVPLTTPSRFQPIARSATARWTVRALQRQICLLVDGITQSTYANSDTRPSPAGVTAVLTTDSDRIVDVLIRIDISVALRVRHYLWNARFH